MEGMEGSVKWKGPTMVLLALSFLNGCIILHGREEPPPQFSPGNEAEFGMLADRLVQQDLSPPLPFETLSLTFHQIAPNHPPVLDKIQEAG